MHRTTLTLFLVLIPFVASCKKNASREASKPPPEIGALATTAANKLERTSGLFVTQNLEDMDAKAGTSAVSLSRPHRAVLALKGLQPGSDYQATFSLSDEQGAELLPSQSVLTFKPEAPDWTVFATFRPDTNRHSTGTWTWAVNVSNLGQFTKEVRVAPLSGALSDALSLTDKARELVFEMVTYSWISDGDKFYTIVEKNREPTLMEVEGFRYISLPELVSAADRRNGLTYKRNFAFGYGYYRSYSPSQNRWSKWEFNDITLNSLDAALWVPFGVGPAPIDHNSRFTVRQEHGHWVVTGRFGTFIDGLPSPAAKKTWAENPAKYKYPAPPSGEYIRQAKRAPSVIDDARQTLDEDVAKAVAIERNDRVVYTNTLRVLREL